MRKSLAGRYYQLQSGHAAIGSYLHDKVDSDECWWCGSNERQSRHHLFTTCRAWTPHIREMWKDIEKACGLRHPRAPLVRLLRSWGSFGTVMEYIGGMNGLGFVVYHIIL